LPRVVGDVEEPIGNKKQKLEKKRERRMEKIKLVKLEERKKKPRMIKQL